jgi:hypothetical protein
MDDAVVKGGLVSNRTAWTVTMFISNCCRYPVSQVRGDQEEREAGQDGKEEENGVDDQYGEG